MSLFGQDLDDLFAYNSIKFVTIRDRRLGLLYYFCSVAILGYVVYNIFATKAFLEVEAPIGDYSFWMERDSDFPSTKAANGVPKYCSNQSYAYNYDDCWKADNIGCYYTSEVKEMYEARTRTELHIRTMYQAKNTTYQALHPDQLCTGDFKFLENIEHTKLMFQHKWRLASDSTRGATDMPCTLVDKDDNHIEASEEGKPLGFSVPQLLQSAGLDLDRKTMIGGITKSAFIRFAGTQLTGTITYENFVHDYSDDVKCHVQFFASEQWGILAPKVEDELVYSMYGLNILLLTGGTIKKFTFPRLMESLVEGMVLFKMAQVAVDILALYFLPMRKYYREAKFQETQDFSEIEAPPSLLSLLVLKIRGKAQPTVTPTVAASQKKRSSEPRVEATVAYAPEPMLSSSFK